MSNELRLLSEVMSTALQKISPSGPWQISTLIFSLVSLKTCPSFLFAWSELNIASGSALLQYLSVTNDDQYLAVTDTRHTSDRSPSDQGSCGATSPPGDIHSFGLAIVG